MPVWGFLGDLFRNGQIYKNELIHHDGAFQAFFFMPEMDSLDEKYCTSYAIKGLTDIKKTYHITTEVLGSDTTVYGLCECDDPSWYILYTNQVYNMSPIVCGDCLKAIPTYKLSRVELPKNCQSELGWQWDYNLIHKLWYLSSFDRFTYRQMSDPKSQLSKLGMEICAAYENALGKPFYYFLFHSSTSGKAREQCPICGSDWKLDNNIGFISHKCDKCRMLSC